MRFGLAAAGVLVSLGLNAGWADDAPKPPPKPPPKAANAWSPAEGFFTAYPKGWRQFHESFLKRSKEGNVRVVFLGDSLTQGWDKGFWDEHLAPLGAVNYGIGGDGTPQVLWRVRHGELDGITPAAVVLMIGVNNRWPGYSAEDTAKGIEAVVGAIREKQPEAKVLLLGVLPLFDRDDPARAWVKEINRRAAKLADDKQVKFLDLGDKFVDEKGDRRPGVYHPDRLHFAPGGYKVLTDAVAAELKGMLGVSKRPDEAKAPPRPRPQRSATR